MTTKQKMLNVPSTMVIDNSMSQFSPSESKKPFRMIYKEVVVSSEVERVNQSID